MKLFRSSQNKSQASLPSSPSRSNSPDQAYSTAGAGAGAGAAGGASSHHSQQLHHPHLHPLSLPPSSSSPDRDEAQQQQQQHQSIRPRSEAFYPPPPQQLQQHDSQIHSHPAHVLSRPSIDLPVPAVYEGRRPSQPSITTTIPSPPQADQQQQKQKQGLSAAAPPQTQFGASRSVHVPAEKENRRSKRSLFGLTSSSSSSNKDKDKENSTSASAPAEKKGGLVGRSGSIHLLRKHNPLSTSISGPVRAPTPDESQSPASSPQQQQQQQQLPSVRHSAFLGKHSASQDDIIREEEDSASSQYEQYRRQQQQQQHLSVGYEYDSSQVAGRREEYQAYQPRDERPNSGDKINVNTNNTNYVAFRATEPQRGGRSAEVLLDPQQQQQQQQQQLSLRPPSRGSIGPPSPVGQAPQVQAGDSRPSTGRYSGQSVGQAPVQVQTMARDQGGQNGSVRQQQHQQQSVRESREDELRQYHQDSRARMAQQLAEQGHSTPPPQAAAQSTSRSKDDPRDMDFNQLVQRYEELQAKYSKVKRYYFEREAQVTQLQNTVATQRLSMSKTSLDDAQYQQRFERLSGAINNLAFNIRKDWKAVVPWLRAVCNHDAHTTGTKEMTAIGRACISRWLAEQVFDRVFHPALPLDISRFLKATEKTLRRQGQSGMLLTEEQRDDLTTKITTWRLTTMEGLAEHFNSHSGAQNQEALINGLTEELTQFLKAHLNEPAPAGLQEGVGAIVQLAINIAANMPLESRDVCVQYFLPGEPINETYMKVETGMTSLTHPGLDERLERVLLQQQRQMAGGGDEADDGNDQRDVESVIREAAGKASQSPAGNSPMGRADTGSSQKSVQKGGGGGGGGGSTAAAGREDKKGGGGGFLGGFGNKKAAAAAAAAASAAQSQSQSQNQRQTGGGLPDLSDMPVDDQIEHMRMLGIPPLLPGEGKVRFAAFFAVDIRGKMLGGSGGGGGGDGGKDGGGGGGGQGTNNSASVGIGRGSGSGVNVLVKAPVYEL